MRKNLTKQQWKRLEDVITNPLIAFELITLQYIDDDFATVNIRIKAPNESGGFVKFALDEDGTLRDD